MPYTSSDGTVVPTHTPFWRLTSFVVLLALLALAGLVYLLSLFMDGMEWLPDVLRNTGSPVLIRMSVIGLAPLLIVGWFLFFAPFNKAIRFAPLGLMGLFIAGFFSLVVVVGFQGDMTPILMWRWNYNPSQEHSGDFTNQIKHEVPEGLWVTDFHQFLGPNRNGKVTGIELDHDWKANPPELVWSGVWRLDNDVKEETQIGDGWPGFATKGVYAVTHAQHQAKEVVSCYHLLTGQEIWAYSNFALHKTGPGGIGPRVTPTIDGDRVYALGATGILDCIKLYSGEHVWTKDLLKDNDAEEEVWGKSCSPLIFEDKVIVGAGGPDDQSLVAYDKLTGEIVWKAGVGNGSQQSSYASPIMASIAGVEQILYLSEAKISGHDPKTGEMLWEEEWFGENSGNPTVSQPIPVSNDRIFLSKGYGGGSKLLQLTKNDDGKFSVEEIWASKSVMKTKFSNAVVVDGYVYGADGQIFQCIELETGKKKWKRGRYGHAQILMVGDVILVMDENNGNLVMLRPNPKKLEVLGKIKILDRKTWNTLTISGPYLLARNDREVVCYKLPLKKNAEKKAEKKTAAQ